MTAPAAGRRIFRSTTATIGAIVSVVVAVVLLGDAWLRAGLGEMLLLAPWVLLCLWLVYALVYAPHVGTDAAGIRLRNILRIIDVPWQVVDDIALRWQLEVSTRDRGRLRAFGGPVAGRPPRPGRPSVDRPRRAPATEDLELIREQWEAARDRPLSEARTRVRWDLPGLVALGAITVWALIALLIVGA